MTAQEMLDSMNALAAKARALQNDARAKLDEIRLNLERPSQRHQRRDRD